MMFCGTLDSGHNPDKKRNIARCSKSIQPGFILHFGFSIAKLYDEGVVMIAAEVGLLFVWSVGTRTSPVLLQS